MCSFGRWETRTSFFDLFSKAFDDEGVSLGLFPGSAELFLSSLFEMPALVSYVGWDVPLGPMPSCLCERSWSLVVFALRDTLGGPGVE